MLPFSANPTGHSEQSTDEPLNSLHLQKPTTTCRVDISWRRGIRSRRQCSSVVGRRHGQRTSNSIRDHSESGLELGRNYFVQIPQCWSQRTKSQRWTDRSQAVQPRLGLFFERLPTLVHSCTLYPDISEFKCRFQRRHTITPPPNRLKIFHIESCKLIACKHIALI